MSDHSSHGSSSSVLLILFVTFVFGFVTGGIIFLKVNTGEGAADATPSKKDQSVRIVAESYGACEKVGSCLSYTIEDGGAYSFSMKTKQTGAITYEDTLTDKQYATLLENLLTTDFESLGKTTFTGTCKAEMSGLSERYTIAYKGGSYQFDVCKQDLADIPLFATLYNYFVAFSVLHKES